ncbi:MAG TPA: hypothetical protein PLD92_07430 [Candidatus Omnitrophota bacterium]|nr:hypothetical protein [Candidatus Omnitrophota bacterium]
MKILSVLFFLVCQYGFGYALTRHLKKNSFETIVLRIGLGLAVIPGLGIVLNRLHIPLDWKIILSLALLVPLIDLVRDRKRGGGYRRECTSPNWKAHLFELGVIALFLVNVWIYCHGAFAYPWLEDDDSWTHAAGIKYIALEKNVNVPPGEFHYINPYPPGYDLTLALCHQISPSLYWTIKFFNAFIVALSFLFFYLWTLELSKSKPLALTAMFLLTCLPSYLSHFIWAHSLVITLFFPAFICLKKSFEDEKFILPGAVCVAGIFLTQPTQSIKFVIMALLLVLAFACAYRKIPGRPILILFLATVLSLVWYGPVAHNMLRGTSRLALRANEDSNYSLETKTVVPKLFSPSSGSATRSYSLNDYLHIPEYNYVNNPTGIGVPVFFLGILGLVVHVFYLLKKPREVGAEVQFYSFTILSWLIFTFLGTNSKTFNLPVGLFAFRFWMLFAIPLSILSADALLWATQIFDTPLKRKIFFLAMVGLLINTTGIYKYKVNTSWWSYGVYWSSDDEVKAFIWMRKNLPVDTKVFKPLDNFLVIGHDMLCTPWTAEYKENLSNAMELSVDELHKRLTRLGYRYIIISPKETRVYGPQTTEDILRKLTEDTRFKTVYTQGKGTRIFKVL